MKPNVDELEQLRSSANLLLTRAQDGTVAELAAAVEKATAVQRLMADLESSHAGVRKTRLEETKLEHENQTAAARERSERRKDYVTLLAPLITVMTLAATLVAQNWQFVRSEKDKTDAALDAQWLDAKKTIADDTHLSPALITLQPFLNSPKYGEQARLTAVQLAINGTDPLFLDELLGIAFVPATWNKLEPLLQIDRGLYVKFSPLNSKSWDTKTGNNDLSKLSRTDADALRYINGAIPKVSGQIGSILKSARPDGTPLDLSNAEFLNVNWSGVNLRGARLENTRFNGVDLKGADLTGIANFAGAEMYYTAWWEAKSISREFLEYLQARFPCNPNNRFPYGSRSDEQFTPAQCSAGLNRLTGAATSPVQPSAVVPRQ